MKFTILRLAAASLWNRRLTVTLTAIAIGLSVALILGVEKMRRDARSAFSSTVSGTDLIVGARSGALQLMLYSVFRIGNATNNVSWASYQRYADDRRVRWSVPLSLGDSHRGFRVLGTSAEYFEHYRYGQRFPLRFAEGGPFSATREAVLGSAVAKELGYTLGADLVVAHGAGDVVLETHDEYPMRAVGILAPTGTPVDRTVHVSLESITLIHIDMEVPDEQSSKNRFQRLIKRAVADRDLTPKSITAFMLGTRSKLDIFRLQRDINRDRNEPLLAALPGVALQELWDLLGVAETVLRLVAAMVVLTGLLGMTTLILSTLEMRRREMAVLRAVGARPLHITGLFVFESALLGIAGVVFGLVMLYAATLLAQPLAATTLGLHLPVEAPRQGDLVILAAIVAAAAAAGLIPAWRAYRSALADGLTIKI